MLYRKRFIPEEVVPLKDDEILFADETKIITKWKTLKPRPDFAWGISCYDLQNSYKISRFLDHNNHLVYYYCDIIEWEKTEDGYLFSDLLADVIIYPNGVVRVVDLAEIADALDEKKITEAQAKKALRILDRLLRRIESEGAEMLFGSLVKEQ